MSGWRRQPPAFSPMPIRAVWGAAGHALGLAADPRPRLVQRLRWSHGRENVLLFGGGTEALVFALLAARRLTGPASVVALPAYSCFDVAAAAVAANVRIALYDVDPTTLGPDPVSLSRTVERCGARAVVITPLYGVPVEWDDIAARLEPQGVLAIEDAAQGHGAAWKRRPLGGLGHLGVLSFGRGKGWSGARGGALLFAGQPVPGAAAAWARGRGDPTREAAVTLSALAQTLLARPALYRLPAALPWLRLGETWYRDAPQPRPMTRAAAGLLEASWGAAAEEAAARRETARALLEALDGDAGVRLVRPPAGGTPGYLRLPVRLGRGMAGWDDPVRALALGIAPGYPATLAELAPVRERLVTPDDGWPGANTLVRELVTLPTHSQLRAAEREDVLRLVRTSGARPLLRIVGGRRDTGGRSAPACASGDTRLPRAVRRAHPVGEPGPGR